MDIATEKTFYLAAAFAARFVQPKGKHPNIHLEFRFGELTMFAGDGRNVAWCKLAVPPTCYCDVGITPGQMAKLAMVADDRPLAFLPQPDGSVRSANLGLFEPVARPEEPAWLERIRTAVPALNLINEVHGRSWGNACLGLATLVNFPSMDNPVSIESFADWHFLRPTDTLRPGILEAWALVGRV